MMFPHWIFRSPAAGSPSAAAALFLVALLMAAAGCDAPPTRFPLNHLQVRSKELESGQPMPPQVRGDLVAVLERFFGTPDEPPSRERLAAWPLVAELLGEVLDFDQLAAAAGPPGADAARGLGGLYQTHCAHCHGLAGDGMGPTAAWTNPYPRDFRLGVFKYKSTPLGARPTDEDLRAAIVRGTPGGAMPGFAHLEDEQVDALLQYVKYLALRGEYERLLIEEAAALDAAYGAERLDTSTELLVDTLLAAVVDAWAAAPAEATAVPPRPEIDLVASARRGRELFHGQVANCVQCHGPTALGDGHRDYYDQWTNLIEPARPERLAEYLRLGAPPPRKILPRNLRQGHWHGGSRPEDLYRRIAQGIDGTPMPPASMRRGEEGVGLTTDDVWHLVDYVRQLPYERLNAEWPGRLRMDWQKTLRRQDPIVRVRVRQYDWEAEYYHLPTLFSFSDEDTVATLPPRLLNELRLPAGRPVYLLMERQPGAPPLALDQGGRSAHPVVSIRVVPTKYAEPGVFPVPRQGSCGLGHYPTPGRVLVMPPDEFDAWLAEARQREAEASGMAKASLPQGEPADVPEGGPQ